MKREWIKIAIGFFGLVLIAYTVSTTAKEHHDERMEAKKAQLAALEILLTRKCKSKWPEQGERFDACMEKVRGQLMYRRDI